MYQGNYWEEDERQNRSRPTTSQSGDRRCHTCLSRNPRRSAMTSLDPSHLPSKHHESRGQAVYSIPTPSGRRKQTLPDLRFEQSYLQSIQPFITFAPSSSSGKEKDHSHQAPTPDSTHSRHGKQEAAEGAAVVDGGQDQDDNKLVQTLYGAPVTINWRGIFWVTTRDQVSRAFSQK